MKPSNRMIAAVGGIALLVTAVVTLTVWAKSKDSVPPADADPVTLAKFVTTEAFEDMIEAQKRPYMRTLRQNADALSAALAGGKITLDEYHEAKQNIWLERQLDKMDDYYKLPAGAARERYLDDLVNHKIEKRKAPRPANATASNEPDTDDDSPFMDKRKHEWTNDIKHRWKAFRNALDAREKMRGL